ncbi:cysteine desulfurase [Synechococcus sp. CS-602]|uniref:cysteine desulfurase family protein n=1 Tax=Synechococcaceae TaxID=1890426 RepID=UPI0008FF1115|nr:MULTISPECIES: cysteine desulfurase family protein [Synechococcaceae]MCT4364248.1 cysteine desulfurase [Candidatus Regnicoccus frigidus MAG-AL1]APD48936.1 cysteine desulfurase [Synechococcus sp. SynAce01]MCT0204556.1 cysteine desulfurase [Synechococcus sp. CS-602]MCT0246386.1 cysteine desulfurase [Synechococcus sp. CS-601]MCT4367106.1 cysteine desulfurase [Candidatus Regnicoccus frigidus MAG-AL2]
MSQPRVEPPLYLDACATAPPAEAVLAVMAQAQESAWANPSSLHGFGLAAADSLERSRQAVAASLGADPNGLIFCSGGTEAAHLALQGAAAALPPGRLVISAVEHPAVTAAAAALERLGWQVAVCPVDGFGRVQLEPLDALLAPPTRLVSVIWGQSEVGTLQPIEAIGRRCRAAGVVFHTDAVQVVGHQPIQFETMPVDLLSFTAHKLQGPRGIGVLLCRPDLELLPLLAGGGQEAGRRAGTEPVVLAAGLAEALRLCDQRLLANGGIDPIQARRDRLAAALLALPGLSLSGCPQRRLPHHISLLVADDQGRPLPGRSLVQALWRQGLAVSSGTACQQGQARGSAVLAAMGYSPEQASSGVRLSLGPWLSDQDLAAVPAAFERAQQAMATDFSR